MHITDVLELVARTQNATEHGDLHVTALFLNDQLGKYDKWESGKVGSLSVSIRGAPSNNSAFEITLDVDENGICHRRQEVGIKKRFAALQSLLQTVNK